MGSCVTRDCFEAEPGDLRCSDYFARTSLVSIVAPPRPLQTEFQADSNFARKQIVRDFDKSFFPALQQAEFDLLVVDFVDERFGIAEHDGTYVTLSHELEKSGLLERPDMAFARLGRFSPKVKGLWEAAVIDFAPRLQAAARGRPIAIHRSMWAMEYENKTGEVVPFDGAWASKIEANNALLTSYYDMLKALIPEAIEVRIPDALTVADEGHKWGLHAIHYRKDYYVELYRRLGALLA